MAKSLPSKKRQEEQLIQELRGFQRANPCNKRCFDCNEMMPQYVCLDFNTFVCTACSGIHREFAHRVKSISMSKFTESEVKNMIKRGGNEAAQKYWRNKHDPSFRPNGGSDGERTRNFIRLTYLDRKWVYESPRHAKGQEPKRTSKSSKKQEKKCDSFSSSSKPAKSTSGSEFGDFSNFEDSSNTAAQSFGDFGNFDSSAPTKIETFADFSNFERPSAAQKAAPKAIPRLPAPKFDSFKIAPPPVSNFPEPTVNAVPATKNLMGLGSPKQTDDPFGFDTPAPTTENLSHSAPVASPPFDFGAPTPNSRAESCSDSASLDPIINMTAAVPSASVPTPQNASPFDAFSSLKVSSPLAFDAFTTPSPASTVNTFDTFGGGEDAFADFTGSSSLSRTNSANPVLDPFATSSEKPTSTAATVDPFAAFDGMHQSKGSASTCGSGTPTSDFGSSTGFPVGNGVIQQQAATSNQLMFTSGTGESSGFPAAQQQHVSGAMNQSFGEFPLQQQPQNTFDGQMQQQQPQNTVGGQMQQQQQPQNAFGGQMQQQQQPPNAFGGHVQQQQQPQSTQQQQQPQSTQMQQQQPQNMFGGQMQQQQQPQNAFAGQMQQQQQPQSTQIQQQQPQNAFGGQMQQQQQPQNTFGSQMQQQHQPQNTFGGQMQQQQPHNAFGGQMQQQPQNTFGGQMQQQQPQNAFGGQMQQQQQPQNMFGGQMQQQQPQNAFGGQMQQQQPQNAFGGQMQQQLVQSFNPEQPPQNQQQWSGQQGFPGQQQPMHSKRHENTGQLPPRPTGDASLAPIQGKTPASASSINDPFASLNMDSLGFGGSSSAARTGSGGVTNSAPFTSANQSETSSSFGNTPMPSGSISYVQPQATGSFSLSQQNTATFADPNAFGDFTSAPAPAPSANLIDLL